MCCVATGDLGYQNEAGYLFVTGRSKDVINRGGEIIAPTEVENAVLQMPGVMGAAAFPVPHDKLQETVGLVLVCGPLQKRPKVGEGGASRKPLLPDVTEFLSELLHPSKWPALLVIMDDLPKGPTGKASNQASLTQLPARQTGNGIGDQPVAHLFACFPGNICCVSTRSYHVHNIGLDTQCGGYQSCACNCILHCQVIHCAPTVSVHWQCIVPLDRLPLLW